MPWITKEQLRRIEKELANVRVEVDVLRDRARRSPTIFVFDDGAHYEVPLVDAFEVLCAHLRLKMKYDHGRKPGVVITERT